MQRASTIERNELIVEMYKSGKTVKEISKDMVLGKEYIRRLLVEANVVEEYKCNRITDETKEEILKKLMDKIPHWKIARDLNIPRHVVGYYAYAYSISDETRRRITPEDIEKMLHLRNYEGLNNATIAARIGCCEPTVYRYIGRQPEELTKIYHDMGAAINSIRTQAQNQAKAVMRRLVLEEKRKQEAARLEAERIERERIEALRLAKENEIKELLASLGIPAENFHIESAETGDAFLNNLITRAAEKLSVGA